MILVSIVTVNYKEEEVTLDFLKSILKYDWNINLEVILVDNGSGNNKEEYFNNIYPGLVYIQSEKNLGFAGGNNLGIQRASGKYIFLLNNDTLVTTTCISTLVTEMENNLDIGLISPLILFYEDKKLIQYAGFSRMNYFTGRNRTIGKFEVDNGQYDCVSNETGFCHGAAMMFRKEDLAAVGYMDESYFLYYEEMDWCEKFRRNGKKIWFTGKAKIYHKESISVGKGSDLKTYFLTRNRILFIWKNTTVPVKIVFGLYFYCLVCPVLLLKSLISGKQSKLRWILKAMCWNLKRSKNNTFEVS